MLLVLRSLVFISMSQPMHLTRYFRAFCTISFCLVLFGTKLLVMLSIYWIIFIGLYLVNTCIEYIVLYDQIFTELGQAPTNDPIVHGRSSTEDVSNALPLVKHVAKFSTKFLQAPLEINYDIVFSLAFVDLFLGKPKSAKPISHVNVATLICGKPTVQGDELLAVLDKVDHLIDNTLVGRGIRIPDIKLYRSMFFKLLADRCTWLQHYSNYIPVLPNVLYLFYNI
jgi:hypothetical protein